MDLKPINHQYHGLIGQEWVQHRIIPANRLEARVAETGDVAQLDIKSENGDAIYTENPYSGELSIFCSGEPGDPINLSQVF